MLVLFVIFVLPEFMSLYYTGYMTLVAVYAVVTLGLGVLVGRVGLFSLGQGAVLQIGAWVGARLLYANGAAVPRRAGRGGAGHDGIGILIGLPVLRCAGCTWR